MNTSANRLFDDWADLPFEEASPRKSQEDIRKDASIVNGGEAAGFKCPSCKGSGRFVSYTGRIVGNCFKCKGKGSVSKGVMAAAKGKATKEANKGKWLEDHADEVAYMRKRAAKGSTYYSGMLEKLEAYGTLFDSNVEAARRDMAKDAEFFAQRKAAAPKVEMSAIEALFAKAVENDHKKPVFRGAEVTLKMAPANGKNPGALYVTETVAGKGVHGEYLGKIVGGKFHAFGSKGADTHAKPMMVAEDPSAEAIRYASKFSACGICGTSVVNPVSIRSIIGPVCAAKFGLEHLRDAAAADLKREKEEEDAKRAAGEVI